MSSGRIYSGRLRVSRLGPTLTAQPEIDQRAPTEPDLGSTVSEQMSHAENVLEVVLTDENGAEHIYWVKTQKAPSDVDIEDWAIAVARERHAVDGRPRNDGDVWCYWPLFLGTLCPPLFCQYLGTSAVLSRCSPPVPLAACAVPTGECSHQQEFLLSRWHLAP